MAATSAYPSPLSDKGMDCGIDDCDCACHGHADEDEAPGCFCDPVLSEDPAALEWYCYGVENWRTLCSVVLLLGKSFCDVHADAERPAAHFWDVFGVFPTLWAVTRGQAQLAIRHIHLIVESGMPPPPLVSSSARFLIFTIAKKALLSDPRFAQLVRSVRALRTEIRQASNELKKEKKKLLHRVTLELDAVIKAALPIDNDPVWTMEAVRTEAILVAREAVN